jgi:hypothetical protein
MGLSWEYRFIFHDFNIYSQQGKMAHIYSYLVFFYWMNGATTTLAVILFLELRRLKRQVRRVDNKIDASTSEINIIKKRIKGLQIDTNINSGDVKAISEKMTSKHD